MIRDLADPAADDMLARHARYWRNGHRDPGSRGARYAPVVDTVLPLFQLSPAAPLRDTPRPHRLEPPERLDAGAFRDGLIRGFDRHGLLHGDFVRVVGTGIASEALVGCSIMVSGGSHWAENCFTGFRQLDGYRARNSIWCRRLLDNTTAALDAVDAHRFPFGCMAFRGPVDMAEAMMGGAALCAAAVDEPERLQHLLGRITDIIIDVGRAHSALLPRYDGGQFSSYRLWTPGSTITLTLDGACLFSPAHYEDLFLPCDRRICEAFESPFVHLHAAARQHFGSWTAIENLGLQCVIDQAWLPEGCNQPIGPQLPELLTDFAGIRDRAALMLYGFWDAESLLLARKHLPGAGCAITGMAVDPEGLRRVVEPFPTEVG